MPALQRFQENETATQRTRGCKKTVIERHDPGFDVKPGSFFGQFLLFEDEFVAFEDNLISLYEKQA